MVRTIMNYPHGWYHCQQEGLTHLFLLYVEGIFVAYFNNGGEPGWGDYTFPDLPTEKFDRNDLLCGVRRVSDTFLIVSGNLIFYKTTQFSLKYIKDTWWNFENITFVENETEEAKQETKKEYLELL